MYVTKLPEEFYELQKIVKPYLVNMGELPEDAPQEIKAAHERMKQIVWEMAGVKYEIKI